MKPLFLKYLLSIFLIAAAVTSFSQEAKKPEVEVGSQVLTQTGNDKYCYNNGVYSYEKIMDIPTTDKKELYSRVKKWVIGTLKTSKEHIFFDDENNNSITVTTGLHLKDNGFTNQSVEFKMIISFKDNKVRIEASEFRYYGFDGFAPQQKPLNDLRPFGKKFMQKIYDDFDENFVAMRKSMLATAKTASSGEW